MVVLSIVTVVFAGVYMYWGLPKPLFTLGRQAIPMLMKGARFSLHSPLLQSVYIYAMMMMMMMMIVQRIVQRI